MESSMKRILLLVFIVLTCSFLQAQIKGSTRSGRLIPPKEPVVVEKTVTIAMKEPFVQKGETWNTMLKVTTIRGSVTGDVSKVVVNGQEAVLLKSNEFHADVRLAQGQQPITVSATDSKGKTTEFGFSIGCNADFAGPFVFILEPVVKQGKETTVKEGTITIHGEAVDESGVSEVTVNGERSGLVNDKEFYANVKLHEGRNSVLIRAVDKAGNPTEKSLSIMRLGDTTGPSITILEPAVSRGVKIVSKKDLLTVKGVAADESGVDEVYINDRRANLTPAGEFTLDIALQPGDNGIIIRSYDRKRNQSLDTFLVNKMVEEMITPGKYYALIIGIDRYHGVWPELHNAVHDAREVESILKSEYRFDEILSLYDEAATRTNIIDRFEQLVSKVTKEDNLIIFYSGHGEFRQQLNKGYWVPADAVSKSTSGYISNSDIQTFMNGILSRHTLLVSDACFSGDIFRGRTEEMPFENSDRYFKEVYRRPSRYALTSGGIEPVMDNGREGHSIFTYYFLNKLKTNTAKYFSAGQLFQEIQIPITNNSEQTPIYQPIKNTGDEGGQFIFIKK